MGGDHPSAPCVQYADVFCIWQGTGFAEQFQGSHSSGDHGPGACLCDVDGIQDFEQK